MDERERVPPCQHPRHAISGLGTVGMIPNGTGCPGWELCNAAEPDPAPLWPTTDEKMA